MTGCDYRGPAGAGGGPAERLPGDRNRGAARDHNSAGRGIPVELTTFRGGSYTDGRHPDAVTFGVGLEEDLARRDFTIGAMALNAKTGEVIDPFGGQADLKNRLIRAVGEPDCRFAEDGLRILRGLRFAAVLGFEIEPGNGCRPARECPPPAEKSFSGAGEGRAGKAAVRSGCRPGAAGVC